MTGPYVFQNNYSYLSFFSSLFLCEISFRSYEAEVAYLEVDSDESNLTLKGNSQGSRIWEKRSPYKSENYICRVNCEVCMPSDAATGISSRTPYLCTENTRWKRSKGRFLSVGAAVISCRNEKAPDGLVADAHLSDGFLHLILIKDCPHACYLWYAPLSFQIFPFKLSKLIA